MENKMTYITILGVVLFLSPVLHAKESVEKILMETKMLYKKAAKIQGAWVTTGKLIKKSEAALKKGDRPTAEKLANKARVEVRLSIKQAEEQAQKWSEPSYIER